MSNVPRMPPPKYIAISLIRTKSSFQHARRWLSGRYRTQPKIAANH